MKNTPEDTRDHELIQSSAARIVALVNRINSAKSKSDADIEAERQFLALIEHQIVNAQDFQVRFDASVCAVDEAEVRS